MVVACWSPGLWIMLDGGQFYRSLHRKFALVDEQPYVYTATARDALGLEGILTQAFSVTIRLSLHSLKPKNLVAI